MHLAQIRNYFVFDGLCLVQTKTAIRQLKFIVQMYFRMVMLLKLIMNLAG